MDTPCYQKKPLTVLQTTCTKHQQLHTENTVRAVGLQDPLHWPQALMLGVVMPTGTALTGVGRARGADWCQRWQVCRRAEGSGL